MGLEHVKKLVDFFPLPLPLSLGVMSVLSGVDESALLAELARLGCETGKIGDLIFLLKGVREVREFVPGVKWADGDSDQTLASVLRIQKWSPNQAHVAGELNAPKQVCPRVTSELCRNAQCEFRHFVPLRTAFTEEGLGFCSYLDLCKNSQCKFLHFQTEVVVEATPRNLALAQWVDCDVRRLPLSLLFGGLVKAILIDPPWDIHMELSYGTMTDDEMRSLPLGEIHNENFGGFVFVWATARTVDAARHCLFLWGYTCVDELVWVKTNQIGGTIRAGRTGHWLNHSKEHCLVGVKGPVAYSRYGHRRIDADVIVAPVRENSRKPDELYGIIERLVGDDEEGGHEGDGNQFFNLELFGRSHNRRPGWVTLGNQLGSSSITHSELQNRTRALGISSH